MSHFSQIRKMPARRRTTTVKTKVAPKRRFLRKKRTYKRKTRNTMKPSIIGFMIQPRKFTKMSYDASWTQGVTAVQASFTQIFRANSVYDPDSQNITKNTVCDGYTLAEALYLNYRVYGVKAKFTFYNQTANTPVQVVICGGNQTSIFATSLYIGDLASRNGAKTTVLAPPGNQRSMATLTKYFNCADLTGQTKEQYRTDPGNQALLTTNPANTAIVSCSIAPLPDNCAVVTSVTIRLKLTYYVELFDLVEQGVSNP